MSRCYREQGRPWRYVVRDEHGIGHWATRRDAVAYLERKADNNLRQGTMSDTGSVSDWRDDARQAMQVIVSSAAFLQAPQQEMVERSIKRLDDALRFADKLTNMIDELLKTEGWANCRIGSEKRAAYYEVRRRIRELRKQGEYHRS